MSSLRWYVADYNGVLTDLKEKLKGQLTTPRNADVWVVWQDAQGSYRDLIHTAKDLGVCPPVYCVQHGRNASYDYAPPNSFEFNADKFLCWGKTDKENMDKLGHGDRTAIVGCPLNTLIKPKIEHKGKTVLFVPVNTGKEEPENIAAYYELMKLRYNEAQKIVLGHRGALKDKWGFNNHLNVSFNDLTQNFELVAKLLPWHDKNLYHGSVLQGYQDMRRNNELIFQLLQNVDVVVGLDEGCTEIYAMANDVPVIIVEGFKYRQHRHDGKVWKYVECDTYKTGAATHVPLEKLGEAIQYALAHPEHLRKERAEVAEKEMGLSLGNATDNILKLIRKDMSLRLSHV